MTTPGPVKLNVGAPSLSVMVPVPMMALGFCGVDAVSVMFSGCSLMMSLTVGTRTIMLVLPAGTLTVMPTNGLNVMPPSVETKAGLVSVPSVAVPLASVSVTAVGLLLALFKLTVKSKLPPSTMVGLLTAATCGRSSSVPPFMPVVPSSTIVPTPTPSPIVARLADAVAKLKFTLKVSGPS